MQGIAYTVQVWLKSTLILGSVHDYKRAVLYMN